MYKSSYLSAKNTKLITILLSISATISSLNITPVSAQWFRHPQNNPSNNPQNNPNQLIIMPTNNPRPNNPRTNNPRTNNPQNRPNQLIIMPNNNSPNNNYSDILMIPAGTNISVKYDEGDKILITRDETLPITLKVATNIKDNQGRLLIPSNSKIVGQIQPAQNGSQFVAQSLILQDNRQYSINANSRIITRTEMVNQGTNTGAILQGTVIGAAAATVLAGITGDKAIATEEVLGGAGLGALAGWLLGGQQQSELIYINPNTDLNLTLQSNIEL